MYIYFDGLVQECSNSIANALELLQSCTKPSIHVFHLSMSPLLHLRIKVIFYV